MESIKTKLNLMNYANVKIQIAKTHSRQNPAILKYSAQAVVQPVLTTQGENTLTQQKLKYQNLFLHYLNNFGGV